nr:hypothetical protein [Algicola sagamiensis]
MIKPKIIAGGLIASVLAGSFCLNVLGWEYQTSLMLGITVLVATYWITEALPIPVTSLLPFFPSPCFWHCQS